MFTHSHTRLGREALWWNQGLISRSPSSNAGVRCTAGLRRRWEGVTEGKACYPGDFGKSSSRDKMNTQEIRGYHPEGNQSWIFIRTDAEDETPILWPPDAKNWLLRKDPDPGKDWRQEKGTTEDEMTGWHHQLDRHEFQQAPEVGDGQGGLACCSPWGRKELDTTERLNWTELYRYRYSFPDSFLL